MKNYLKPGKSIDYVNSGAAIASGAVVLIGGILPGIASVDIAATTGKGAVEIEGVYSLEKTSMLVIAQGERVFWNNSTKKVTKTVTDVFMGVAAEAAGASDAKVAVRLIPLGDSEPGNLAQAAYVAPLGATADLVGVDGMGSNAAPLVGTEARLDAIEAKLDATLAALVAANLMAAS